MICLLGHHWSDWWMASDGCWYRRCTRGCGTWESRQELDGRSEIVATQVDSALRD